MSFELTCDCNEWSEKCSEIVPPALMEDPYMKEFECRKNCGACCIAPSISSPIPGMPDGKRAGERCIHLDEEMRCRLFGKKERPAVCGALRPSAEMCGSCREEAMAYLTCLEKETSP